jgi:hypothetical protein
LSHRLLASFGELNLCPQIHGLKFEDGKNPTSVGRKCQILFKAVGDDDAAHHLNDQPFVVPNLDA